METFGSYVYVPDANVPPALDQVGGKALGLFRLIAVGCEVPKWFALSAQASRVSREAQTPKIDEVAGSMSRVQPAPSVMAGVEDALKRLDMTDGYLAVRSSARVEDGSEQSFAGQFATVLYVKPEDLPDAIAQVWASAGSDHCLEYAKHNRVSPDDLVPAVVIQQMITPDAAGVVFTADPVSGDRDRKVVAATYGLGEGIVSGACSGDTYTVGRDGVIVSRSISTKTKCLAYDERAGKVLETPLSQAKREGQVCPDAMLVRLAELGDSIAAEFGTPQDIEWCLLGDTIHILQTRPITSLTDQDGVTRIWDNANIVESYPGVTLPLTFSFIEPIYSEVYRRMFRQFGLSENYLRSRGASYRMLGYYLGRVYYNLLSWYRNLCLLPGGRRHLRHFDEMLGTGDGVDPNELPRPRGPGFFRSAWVSIRLLGRYLLQPLSIRRFMRRVKKARDKTDSTDLDSLRLDELVDYYKRQEGLLVRGWTTPQFNDFFCQSATGLLKSAISKWLGDRFVTSMHELLPVDQSVESERAVASLCALAASIREKPGLLLACRELTPRELLLRLRIDPEIGARLDEHVQQFGDRWHGELKLETVTPREDPEVLVGVLAQHVLAPTRETAADPASPIREAIAGLPVMRRTAIGILARISRRLIANRENTRFERTRVFGLVRRAFRMIGQKLEARGHLESVGDVFYLTKDEIFAFIDGTSADGDLSQTVNTRRTTVERWQGLQAPGRFRSQGLLAETTAAARPAAEGQSQNVLSGIGASPGVIRARLRVIRSPEELDGARGCIIATESTDPGWSFIFPLISGVLVERGSILSHAAIVAREMGIPAVVAVDGLMEQLKDGSLVELDGGAGTVRVIED